MSPLRAANPPRNLVEIMAYAALLRSECHNHPCTGAAMVSGQCTCVNRASEHATLVCGPAPER